MNTRPKKRRGPGRPPKLKSTKRGKCVMVRLTNAERRQLAKDAKAAGDSLGGHLREVWLSNRKGA